MKRRQLTELSFSPAGSRLVGGDGQTCAKFRSREGAIGFYEKIIDWSSGELDELVKEHLAKIPPRRKRTGGDHDD